MEPTQTKSQTIQNSLAGVLSDGDIFVVHGVSGKIEVRPIGDKDSLKAMNPDLHGKLLRYEQKLTGEGNIIWIFILLAVVINLTIGNNWLRTFGIDLSDIQSWWTYIGVVLLMFIANNKRLSIRVKKYYKMHSANLKQDIENAGLNVDLVVSMTAKDGNLFNVRQCLMMD